MNEQKFIELYNSILQFRFLVKIKLDYVLHLDKISIQISSDDVNNIRRLKRLIRLNKQYIENEFDIDDTLYIDILVSTHSNFVIDYRRLITDNFDDKKISYKLSIQMFVDYLKELEVPYKMQHLLSI